VSAGTPGQEHDAADFIRACAWIRENCPGVNILGNILNLSAGLKDNDPFRGVLHTVFLKRASEAGLTMAVVNPSALVPWDALEDGPRRAAEETLFGRTPEPRP
jgi:5-methyltetrahydrofolate--homocysteine methyltransferase